ncbi:MAG: glycosyltransferase family 4 protein [Candidatus Shapirobacteria bacterium]
MKILIGLTYYLPNISGVSVYANILAEELSVRNYQVKIICSKSLNQGVVGIDGFSLGKGYIMPMYWLKSIEHVKWADVVNCHLPSIESFWLALWARIFNKKLVVTHHCEFMFTGTLANKIIAIISWPIHFFVYLMADKIVAYTKDYANYSSFLKIFKKKLVYILPTIKITPLKRQKQNKLIIGYVGRIAWEKGLNRLINIIPLLKKEIDFEMWWIGPFKNVKGDNYYEKIKLQTSNFKKHIKLIGPVEHEKLNKYYAKMDCLVLPSTDNLETFGIVQVEAMVCGVPCVASNLPGVRVPVTMTGMGEIASVTDDKDLFLKIIKVLKNKYVGNKSLKMFDYKKTVDQYEEVFGITK